MNIYWKLHGSIAVKEEERESFIFAHRTFQLLGDKSNSIVSHRITVTKSLNGYAYHICVRLSIHLPVLLQLYYPIPFLNVLCSNPGELV